MESAAFQPPDSDLERRIAERVAGLVVDLVRDELGLGTSGREWIDAKEVARRWGFSRAWVYAHARQLGAVATGHGPRPRLRFEAQRVAEAVRALGELEGEDDGREPVASAGAPVHVPRVRQRRSRS